MQIKKLAPLAAILLSLMLVILLYPKFRDPAAFRVFLANLGWQGIFLDLIILALQMIIPTVPFALLAGANVLLYGWLLGFVLSLTGSMLGSSTAFWLARLLGQGWPRPKVQRFERLVQKLDERSFLLVLTGRLIPIIPATAINYAAGLSKMSFISFFAASLLGKIPIIAWEAWLGHDFWRAAHHPLRLFLALGLGAIVLGSALYFNLPRRFLRD